jgi:asparagine synthase (glutamine-hydrolysing)
MTCGKGAHNARRRDIYDMPNALSILLHHGDEEGARRAAASFQRQGFQMDAGFEWSSGKLATWTSPSVPKNKDCVVTPQGVACCVGPIWYRRKFGSAALGLILSDIATVGEVDETAIRGNFALVASTPMRCMLMNDPLGFVRIYISPDQRFYSTSWLATCAYAGKVELDAAAAVEYVLIEAPHSTATPALGITTLPLGSAIDLLQGRPTRRLVLDVLAGATVPSSFDVAVGEIRAYLGEAFADIADAFPSRTRAALSGGFDSRLIIAGLLGCGDHPDLFVYGQTRSSDVSIAKAVASSVGLPLEVIDKGRPSCRVPPPSLNSLVAGALFFDGLPNDGILDAEVDRTTRLQQNADGYIALNGGGGEVFRNYFHLPNRPFRACDLVQAFYRGFDSRVLRNPGALAVFKGRLAASMERTLGIDASQQGHLLTREQIELLYPLFRCHHWMAVNNSVAVRHGYYSTPLLDLNTATLAWRLPLRWKDAGRLESSVIASLHPILAAQPSAYGFRFIDGPDWRTCCREWMTRKRPVVIRPLINAAGRHFRRIKVQPSMVAQYRALLPGEWRLDGLLDLENLPGRTAFGRALAIEIAWRTLLA